MSTNKRRIISLALLGCLCASLFVLPTFAAEVTRPATTSSAHGEIVDPLGDEPGDFGRIDGRKGSRGTTDGNGTTDGMPDNNMPKDNMPKDGMPGNDAPDKNMPNGEYNADENGMVAGATDDNGMTNWIVWGVVIALLVAAAIVAGVVFLVPSRDED